MPYARMGWAICHMPYAQYAHIHIYMLTGITIIDYLYLMYKICRYDYKVSKKKNIFFFDHKNTFLDTHKHFRPAIEISRRFPIVCKGLELKNNNFKKDKWLDAQPMNDSVFLIV